MTHFTDHTLDTLPALLNDIQQIRTRGWSIDDEEHTLGMRCIAAPLFNEHGEAIAGISISGRRSDLPKEKLGRSRPGYTPTPQTS